MEITAKLATYLSILIALGLPVGGSPLPWHSLKHNIPKPGPLASKDSKNTAGVGSSKWKYFIIRKRLTWIQAQDACDEFCSKLAVFESLDQAQAMQDVLSKLEASNADLPDDYFTVKNKYEYGLDRRYWIGLTDLGKEGLWRWAKTDYLLNYTDMWYPNQPDHLKKQKLSLGERRYGGASEHCVTFWNPAFHIKGEKHTFNDEPCNMEYYGICDPQPDNRELLDISTLRGYPCQSISGTGG